MLCKQINLGNLESMNLGLPKLCNVLTIISCILYIVTIDVPYKSLKLKPLCAQGWPRGAGHALGLFEFVDFQGKLLDKSPCLESDQRNHCSEYSGYPSASQNQPMLKSQVCF